MYIDELKAFRHGVNMMMQSKKYDTIYCPYSYPDLAAAWVRGFTMLWPYDVSFEVH